MSIDLTNNQVVHIKDKNIEYLQFKRLLQYEDKLKHLITLRHGGVSKEPCDSLNFRVVGNDSKENVFENLDRVCKMIKIDKSQVYKGKQAHTDNILIINNENKEEFLFENISKAKYDGYICKDINIATLVTTADCNPIIIYDCKKNIYANIHSGWKGTIKRIYLKAVKIMNKEFGCKFGDLIVCVGPSILKCCFSSEEENFKKQFTNVWEDEKRYISYEENKKRFHIDLPYVIKKDLLEVGLKEENIVFSNICTKCNTDSFFSFRDSTQKKQSDYGTMATIVLLNNS